MGEKESKATGSPKFGDMPKWFADALRATTIMLVIFAVIVGGWFLMRWIALLLNYWLP